MSALDEGLFGDSIAAGQLAAKFMALDPQKLLRFAIEDLFPGRIALVASFGADSAVLLHMVSEIDKATPVIFIDTLHLFPETLAYRDELVAHLKLTNVKTVQPEQEALAKADPEKFLWASDPDACCHLRKVQPLAKALEGYEAWITGRKRYQAETRSALPLFEVESGRVKVNPLAAWSAEDAIKYLDMHRLPRHSLVAKGYPSIGCVPCTAQVKPGEDPRAGRWRGRAKVECGIHVAPLHAGSDI
jgi:phosphoadenosine phosphosulfate reductase